MRLVIGGPTLATVPASFALDLARLYEFTKSHGPWSSVELVFQPATYVHVGRERVLQVAISTWRATHVLWLDTDMSFPADTAVRLAKHNQPVVACNCVMKDPRVFFTARCDGKPVETRQDSSGLEAVDTVGMAVMLMRTDVVAGLESPWFKHGVNADGDDIGEDVMFCRYLNNTRRRIYIDHDLSKEIGHIGQHTFRPDRHAVAV